MKLTTRPRLSRARALGAAATIVCAALVTTAAGSPQARRSTTTCPIAGRASVSVPDGIDGFRVIVADARPGAATDVTILADGRDRTLRAFAPGEIALLLDAPLRARRIEVALEPVLEARTPACVERVELLRDGAVVGAAEIR